MVWLKNFFISALVWVSLGAHVALAACSGGTNSHSCWYTTAGSNTAPYDTEAKACATLAACITQMAAGDTLFVVNTSVGESLGANTTYTFPGTSAAPNYLYNVATGTTTPTAGSAGAGIVNTTGGNSLTFAGDLYWYGCYISVGSGALNPALTFSNGLFVQTVDTCNVIAGATGNVLIRGNNQGTTTFLNTTVTLNGAGSGLFAFGTFNWIGGSLAGTAPNNLLNTTNGGQRWLIRGVDLSLMTSGNILSAGAVTATAAFQDIKLGSGVTLSAAQTGPDGCCEFNFIRAGTNAAGAANNARITQAGTMSTVTASAATPELRTGGATDGVTPISWNLITTARANWATPLTGFPLSVWNTTTGAQVSVTLEGIASVRDFASAIPTNQQVWFDIEYLGASGNPQGTTTRGTTTTLLSSAVALNASAAAWDGSATAWAATTAYPLGTVRKFTGCAGQLYEVTAVSGSGTSGGSQPACQSDGGSVVDNSGANQLTWSAMWRFNQTVQTGSNVQLAGPITITPKVAIASLTDGVWLDPQPTITGVAYARSFALSPGVYNNSLSSGGGGSRCIGC